MDTFDMSATAGQDAERSSSKEIDTLMLAARAIVALTARSACWS